MFSFANKSKGFCVEIGEHNALVARLSQNEAPILVEELKELPLSDNEAVVDYIRQMEGKGPTGYAMAKCGVYPPRRVIRRQTLDLKRVKEPAYFNEILAQQFRIEPEKYTVRILNSSDGREYDAIKASQKEVLFCGVPSDDINSTQDKLLEMGVYPECLELSTVATLGAMVDYLSFKQSKAPVLLLEIGADLTQSFILSADGIEISRPIPSGTAAMIPVVLKELGLKDEESAKKLFYSNTFDFTSMGPMLIRKLIKELQSSIGFYEVQTGQSIGSVLCAQLPANLGWLGSTMAGALGVPQFKMDFLPWLEAKGIRLADGVASGPLDERWIGLFALMATSNNGVPANTVEKK